MKPLLILLLISSVATAQPKYYTVSGKVIDPITGKGVSHIYVALQTLTIGLLFGGPETFEDLAIDSTDKNGNFIIKAPAKLVDSFIENNSSPWHTYYFALDARSSIGSWHYQIYGHTHTIGGLHNIEGNSFKERHNINHSTVMLSKQNEPILNELPGIVIKFTLAGQLQFWLPQQDSAFLKDSYLYVSVQELTKKGDVISHGYTTYDKGHLDDVTLVRPHIPFNIILVKGSRKEHRLDTFAVIKNLVLKPKELKRIRLTSAYH